MIKLMRWIFGYVEFIFTGGFADGFMNDCYQQKINIHDTRKTENGLSGVCLAREYKRIHSVARRHGGRVKITKRSGLLFMLMRLKSRTGLIAGALAFLIIINTLSGFVWSIEVVGNEELKTPEIISVLEKNGFKTGVQWKKVSTSTLENILMATYDECAHVHINRYASRAVVEISEAVMQPEVDNTKGRANLRASKDGIIVYTNIKRGWDIIDVGSAVSEGDLLASGVHENELNKTNHFTHASGEVVARVKEPFSLVISRKQTEKIYTEEKERKVLLFFGLRLPLYIGISQTQNCEITEKNDYIKLNEKALPIGISTRNYRYYVSKERELSDKELRTLVKEETDKKLKKDYADCEIVNKSIKTELKKDSGVAQGELTVLEDIAEEVAF